MWRSNVSLLSIMTPKNLMKVTCSKMVLLKITGILVSDDFSLARWKIMKCDLEVLRVLRSIYLDNGSFPFIIYLFFNTHHVSLTYLHFINQSSLCHQVKQTKSHHAVVKVELTVSCQSSTIVYYKHPTLHRTTSNAHGIRKYK